MNNKHKVDMVVESEDSADVADILAVKSFYFIINGRSICLPFVFGQDKWRIGNINVGARTTGDLKEIASRYPFVHIVSINGKPPEE